MKDKVNLLIIGTQKAGTTSLFHYLKQHPEVYFSEVKEVNYFVGEEHYKKGETYYHSFFGKYSGQKVIASAYVHMLPCFEAPARVREYNKNMKFIVMLREPLARAISSYNYAIKNGWEESTISFSYAFLLEEKRLKEVKIPYDLTYFYNGLYYHHLSHWFNYFNRDNFLILVDEELKKDANAVMKKIYRFLDIGDLPVDTSKKFNEAGEVKSKFIQKVILTRSNVLRKTIGNVIGQETKVFIRSKIFPVLIKMNTSKVKKDYTREVLDDPQTLKSFEEYFANDLKLLQERLNIKFKK